MDTEKVTREHLVALLRGGNAHMTFNQAVTDFPIEAINRCPPNVEYTPWHLLEHMRITQRDILDFIRDPGYQSPPWPAGYWPARDAVADEATWQKTITGFRSDLQALEDLAKDPHTDLYTPLPHGTGQTIFRELLLVADHTAYHTGEFAILRQVMGTWPANRKS